MTGIWRFAAVIAGVWLALGNGAVAGDGEQRLLTQEQAVERVSSLIEIPVGYELCDGHFSAGNDKVPDWGLSVARTRNPYWQLAWRVPNSVTAQIWAMVDALNGDIISYTSNEDRAVSADVTCTKQDASRLIDAFLAQIEGRHVSQCERRLPEYVPENGDPARYVVSYVRILDGIKYLDDKITVWLDPQNGRIDSYRVDWTDAPVHPDFDGIISAQQAEQAVLDDAGRRGDLVIPPIFTELVMNDRFWVSELITCYRVMYEVCVDGEPEGCWSYVAAHPNPDGSVRVIFTMPMLGLIGREECGEEKPKLKKMQLPEVKLVWVRSLHGVWVQWLGKEGAELKFRGQAYRLVPGSSVVDTPRKRVTSRSRIQIVNGRLMVPEDLCDGLGIGIIL